MLRTITLSLVMLVSVLAMLPFANSTAHGIRQSVSAGQQRRYRRHSRAWWRRYRARLRQRRAEARSHRTNPLAVAPEIVGVRPNPALQSMPAGWNSIAVTAGGEAKFRTEAS